MVPSPSSDPPPADLERALEESEQGDAEAFNAVVTSTAPRLFRLAVRLMANQSAAEDVLQESYARAFDAVRARRFERRAGVETWLYRIVTHTALDALRSPQRAPPEPEGAGDAQLGELSAGLDELPVDERVALVLKELEGMSVKAVAEALGSSEGAVEQRLLRARKTLGERSDRG